MLRKCIERNGKRKTVYYNWISTKRRNEKSTVFIGLCVCAKADKRRRATTVNECIQSAIFAR